MDADKTSKIKFQPIIPRNKNAYALAYVDEFASSSGIKKIRLPTANKPVLIMAMVIAQSEAARISFFLCMSL